MIPYPQSWASVGGATYIDPLVLSREIESVLTRTGDDALYVVHRPYSVSVLVDATPLTITVPAGMPTDLASVPRVARSVAGRVGPHLEAAIVHDYLYCAWLGRDAEPDPRDRLFADRVFLRLMEAAEVSWMQRQIIYRAVRAFGWPSYKKRVSWWADVSPVPESEDGVR